MNERMRIGDMFGIVGMIIAITCLMGIVLCFSIINEANNEIMDFKEDISSLEDILDVNTDLLVLQHEMNVAVYDFMELTVDFIETQKDLNGLFMDLLHR